MFPIPRALSLFNWDYWPPVRLPLDREVVLLTGPNGSGKTSLLDAIRQLLNAPRLSSQRRLPRYLRRPEAPALIRAVVSNEDVGFGQPFRRERLTTPEVTLACMLVPASGGTPEKRFAVLPSKASVEEIRARLLQPRGDYLPARAVRPHPGAGRGYPEPDARPGSGAREDEFAVRAGSPRAPPVRPGHDGGSGSPGAVPGRAPPLRGDRARGRAPDPGTASAPRSSWPA